MDGSKCAESGNSTDCLLRDLLQFLSDYRTADDAKTDWDPRNFYMTLIIGVIATYIAIIPIMGDVLIRVTQTDKQTTESIIGKWSRLNRIRWNWATMAFDVTAYTPVLGVAFLQEWIKKQKLARQELEALYQSQSRFEQLPYAMRYNLETLNRGRFEPAAKWCGFLGEIGLNGVDPERMRDNDLRPVPIDNLPEDIGAPPAYAEVGFIAAAVASKGVQAWSVNSQSGESTLIGVESRFNLRQHSTLGLVGVYLRSEPRIPEIRAPSPEELLEDIFYGRGVLILETETTRTPNRRIPSPTEIIYLLDGMNRNQISDSLSGSSEIFSRYSDYFWPQGFSLPRNCMLIFSLFFCTVPRKVPGLFPISAPKTKHPLTILALNGTYWANVQLGEIGGAILLPEASYCPNWVNMSWNTDTKTFTEIKIRGFDGFYHGRPATPTTVPDAEVTSGQTDEARGVSMDDQKVQKGDKTVLYYCLKLLHDPEELEDWFSRASPSTRDYLRLASLEQLREIDRWIEKKTAKDSQRRSATLAADSMILYKAMEHVEANSEKSTAIETTEEFEPEASDSDGFNNAKAATKTDNNGQEESDDEYLVRDSPRNRHSDLLLALRDLLTTFSRRTMPQTNIRKEQDLREEKESTDFTGDTDNPFDLRLFSSKNAKHRGLLSYLIGGPPVKGEQVCNTNTNGLLRRLGIIVANNLQPQDDWLLRKQFSEERENEVMRDLDDMIIYRCLILALLFRTAQDTTDLLRSGLWEQVIPIL